MSQILDIFKFLNAIKRYHLDIVSIPWQERRANDFQKFSDSEGWEFFGLQGALAL